MYHFRDLIFGRFTDSPWTCNCLLWCTSQCLLSLRSRFTLTFIHYTSNSFVICTWIRVIREIKWNWSVCRYMVGLSWAFLSASVRSVCFIVDSAKMADMKFFCGTILWNFYAISTVLTQYFGYNCTLLYTLYIGCYFSTNNFSFKEILKEYFMTFGIWPYYHPLHSSWCAFRKYCDIVTLWCCDSVLDSTVHIYYSLDLWIFISF